MKKVRTEKELADAVQSGESTIIIEGDLGKKIVRIKATGRIAWAVLIGALALAVVAIIAAGPSAGTTVGLTAPSLGIAFTILGTAAVVAINLVAAGRGTGVLTQLRDDYRVSDAGPNEVVLTRS